MLTDAERADAHAKLIAPILEDLKAARDKLDAIINGTLDANPEQPEQYLDQLHLVEVRASSMARRLFAQNLRP